jgi:hypothetical protein
VSDIPGVVHMVEYHDMGDSIWIVLERGDHTKVNHISKKVKNFKKKYFMTSCSLCEERKGLFASNYTQEATCKWKLKKKDWVVIIAN